jgi:hypothetical protein
MTTLTAHSHDNVSALHNQFRMTHTFHLLLGASEPVAGQLEST